MILFKNAITAKLVFKNEIINYIRYQYNIISNLYFKETASKSFNSIVDIADNFIYQISKNISTKSPLRYPGGKTRAVEFISKYIPENITTLLSPFFGGGSIELFLTSKNIKIIGFDIFQPLVEFWQELISNPNILAAEVQKYYPLTKNKFYELQQKQEALPTRLERAAAYYVLNRSSFSGATLSGGMSPSHPRFTPSSIERIKNFYNPNLKIEISDFKDSLIKHFDIFAYIDPPYLIKSSLYGKKGDAHKDFDHKGLNNILTTRERWILSYNDSEEIRDMYGNFKIITLNWKYGMSNDKSAREILIFSKDLK